MNLSFRIAPVVESVDAGLPQHFSGVCYSGGVVSYGYMGDCAIDLSSMQTPSKALFALVNHDPDQRAGRLSLINDGTALSITSGSFLKTPTGQQVASEFADQAPWEFSVGFTATPAIYDRPTAISLNGRSMTVDCVFQNARITEVSFVPAGADPNTQAVAFSMENLMSEPSVLELTRALDAEKQAKTDLEARLEATDVELTAAKAEVVRLTDVCQQADADKADLEVRLKVARQELADLKADVRLSAVKTLFADLGREFSDAAAKPYLDLTDEVFGFMAAEMKAGASRKSDPVLFQEQATSGRPSDPQSQVVALAAELRKTDPSLSVEQATARVLRQNPDLYHARTGA